ncbi:hypothetical protein [Nonomuraea sp. GTA35]|uniref:hypothetical protein n=1 Tax=Nonomuraea sp. GTA35 TaxID=1676746 RepID=UPI0035C08BE4
MQGEFYFMSLKRFMLVTASVVAMFTCLVALPAAAAQASISLSVEQLIEDPAASPDLEAAYKTLSEDENWWCRNFGWFC